MEILSEETQIMNLAKQIRNTKNPVTFTISTNLLEHLLASFKEETVQKPNSDLTKDLIFLQNHIKNTKSLKLRENDNSTIVFTDITMFENINQLEFHKVDINMVKGMQKIYSQLQKLTCHRTGNNLKDILRHCGGDRCHSYYWNELKQARFTNNEIVEIDQSFECTPWLHTLDLSHNQIVNIEPLACLSNLKCLNLAYNKLETFPHLNGQICTRLQVSGFLTSKNDRLGDI